MRVLSLALLSVLAAPVTAMASSYAPIPAFQAAYATGVQSGVYRYGYSAGDANGNITTSSFQQDDLRGTSGTAEIWYPTASGAIQPLVGYNPGGMQIGTTAAPANELLLHPANSDAYAAVLRFIAPGAGTYKLSGLFDRLDDGQGNGVYVSIYEGGTALLIPTLLTPPVNNVKPNIPFSYTVTLGAGQTLDFDVARHGDYGADTTGLQLSLVSTPEPSSIALLGTGLLGAAGMARRRFVKA